MYPILIKMQLHKIGVQLERFSFNLKQFYFLNHNPTPSHPPTWFESKSSGPSQVHLFTKSGLKCGLFRCIQPKDLVLYGEPPPPPPGPPPPGPPGVQPCDSGPSPCL